MRFARKPIYLNAVEKKGIEKKRILLNYTFMSSIIIFFFLLIYSFFLIFKKAIF